jgi:activator of HSP90 ATPase
MTENLIRAATRRQMITGVGAAIVGLAAASSAEAQSMKAEEQSVGAEGLLTYLHQEIDIKASAHRIYEALLESKQFAAFTGMPAEINREAGGTFSTFGGLIHGRNVELLPDQRIVQAWRPGDWAPGVYSLVKFEIGDHGANSTIVLDHTGFPEGSFRHLDSGWYLRYWEPLKKYLA